MNTLILSATNAWFILCTNKIFTYVLKKSYFMFPITKGSVNALMWLAGFSTSNKVKNQWSRSCELASHTLWKFLGARDAAPWQERSIMVRWVVGSILHGGPIELFQVPTSAPRLEYQIPWYVIACLCDGAYGRPLAGNRNE